jgi:hypothetical protein
MYLFVNIPPKLAIAPISFLTNYFISFAILFKSLVGLSNIKANAKGTSPLRLSILPTTALSTYKIFNYE